MRVPVAPDGRCDPRMDYNPARCWMLYSGVQCDAPAWADCTIGCEGERVRVNRYCARCVQSLENGLFACLPCALTHPVQLLRVKWDADGKEAEA